MRSLYRTLSLRYLQQRWSRALLIVASIALGVATLVATRALNDSVWIATQTTATPLAGAADLYVSNDEAGVERALATELLKIPGVRAAEPLVVGRVRLPDLGEQARAQVLGIIWQADSLEKNPWGVQIDWTIAPQSVPGLKGVDLQTLLGSLKKFFGLRPILVGEHLAEQLATVPVDGRLEHILDKLPRALRDTLVPKELEDKLKTALVRVQPAGKPPYNFIKVGTVRASGLSGDLVKNVLIMNAADAAEMVGEPDRFTRIDLMLQPRADAELVRQRVEAVLRGRAQVQTPGENAQQVQQMTAGLQLGFALSGAGALVVGLFLVYNALSVSVAERRHEIGILRALGAVRSQVLGLIVGEAALLGLLGVVLGIPAGVGLAHLGLQYVQQLMTDLFATGETRRLAITPLTVALAVAAGLATTVLAAFIPAVRATDEEPARAVRRLPPLQGLGHRMLQLAVSLLLIGAGMACVLYRTRLPARWGTYGGFVLVLLGMLLTTPLLAAFAARLLQPAARWLLGLGGRLAADNLVRVPGRTGLVITALAAGVAIFVETAGVIRSNRDPILGWIDQTVDAELIVFSGSPVPGQNLLLPADLGRTMRQTIPGIRAALPLRQVPVAYGNNRVSLLAIDAAGFNALQGRCGPLMDRRLYVRLCEPGAAVVSQNFAALYHVHKGDVISLNGRNGPVRLRVVGTAVDYNFPRGTVLVDRGLYEQQFGDARVDEFYVYLEPRADVEQIKSQLQKRWANEHALVVWERSEVLRHFDNMVWRFSAIAYSQEIVVGLVAALGVVTALLISVLQRRRELGILRALGATRPQVLRSVLAEATLMGVVGSLIGLLIGVPVEWYCVHVILFEETGFLFPVLIPWGEAAIIAGGALTLATLAGLGPALHTMHLRIPEAIAYE